LRLQPYRQISVGGRRPQKLSPLFYGPYRVLQRVGTVAYKLEPPEEAKLHPVFHVSQLKKKLGEAAQVQHQVPSHYVEQILVPELMLERRMMNMKGKAQSGHRGSDQMEELIGGRGLMGEILGVGEEVPELRP